MRPIFHPALVNDAFGDPGLFVDFLFERRAILFDLGDIRTVPPRKLLRISDIFVSHCHMDHFMGFDWLLRICLGRERGINLYGPPGFIRQVNAKLSAYTWNLVHRYENDFTLTVTEVDECSQARRTRFHIRDAFQPEPIESFTLEDDVLCRAEDFGVRYAMLDHGIPCLAFALEETQHVNIWKNCLAEKGLPVGSWLQALKRLALNGAADEETVNGPDGRVLKFGELKNCLRFRPGSKMAYVTDVLYTDVNAARIIALALDADVLFIESVFLDQDEARATDKKHLTAGQAGRLGRAARVRQLIPFHFSPIYRDRPDALPNEALRVFQT